MRTSSYTFAFLCFFGGLLLGATTIAIAVNSGGSSKFPDVPFGSYYDTAVGEMAELGVIRGRPDGTFNPGAPATRADIAVMLKRLRDSMLGLDVDTSNDDEDTSDPVTDDDSSNSSSTTIRNPEGSVRFTIGDFTVQEDAGTAKVTLIRTGGADGVVSVKYALEDGTAKAGADYVTNNGTLTFANGETSRMFFVTILDDESDEGNESFTIKLSDPEDGVVIGVPDVATILIQDDDADVAAGEENGQRVQFGALSYAVAEDGGSIDITVERLGGSEGEVAVQYATADDTARSISDYDAESGTLTFADGETEKSFTITIDDDQSTEGNEKITLTLKNPSGIVLGDPSDVDLTIVDDDMAIAFGTGSLRLDAEEYEVLESSERVVITVERRSGGHGEIQVEYDTISGTAKVGYDYEETSGVLMFRNGEMEKIIIIPIVDDDKSDPNEAFTFRLSNPTRGATLTAPSDARITILQ